MRKVLKYIFLSMLVVALSGACGVGIYVWSLMGELPDVSKLSTYKPPLTTTIKSRDGVLMAELYRENRYLGDPRQLPGFVRKAFIAAEDDKFYDHAGLDFQGILRAALTNLKEGRFAQGGSTITQQVARTLLLSREKSIERKAKEGILALKMERQLEKDEILNLYLNQIYLGHGAYGIEAAARVYFGVSAWELSIAQAALLAGLPQAPSRYDPYKNPAQAIERRGYVIERMFENGWITAEETEEAKRSPLGLKGYSNPFEDVSPYYSEYVRQALLERFDVDTVLEGGLTVTTSMDSRLQRAAREALREGLKEIDLRGGYRGPVRVLGELEPGEAPLSLEEEESPFFEGEIPTDGTIAEALITKVSEDEVTVLSGAAVARIPIKSLEWTLPRRGELKDIFVPGQVLLCRFEAIDGGGLAAGIYQEPLVEGAIISLDAATGEVLAAVGGFDYNRSQFNRFSQAKRQVGSAIKPLIYAAAINSGYTPASLIYDSPIVYESDELDKKWKPKNYSSRFYGATTLRDALVNSRNVVTIKLLKEMGIQKTVNFLRKLGITSEIPLDLSLALGAPSMTLMDLAATYSIFATGGFRSDPVFIKKIEDYDGTLIEEYQPGNSREPVLDPAVAYVINNIMQSIIKEGTGRRARGLSAPSAGKTGTTNDTRDAWFAGFTPKIVTVVWVGYDDGASLGSKETGGRAAAPIWKRYMEAALAIENDPGDFSIPPGIEFARVDTESGKLAGPNSKKSFNAAFLAGTVPQPAEPAHTALVKETPEEKTLDFQDPGALDLLR